MLVTRIFILFRNFLIFPFFISWEILERLKHNSDLSRVLGKIHPNIVSSAANG